jgi:hypothetical protein
VPESIALYSGMDQLLPQPQISATATAARYRPMPQEPMATAATTAPTTTILAQEAAVGDTIDLDGDADLPVPLVPMELNSR